MNREYSTCHYEIIKRNKEIIDNIYNMNLEDGTVCVVIIDPIILTRSVILLSIKTVAEHPVCS